MEIKIDTIDKIHKFINITNSFKSDIDVKRGHYILDGKSIMGIYSLDLSKEIEVSINSDDEREISRFEESMKEFKVKGE